MRKAIASCSILFFIAIFSCHSKQNAGDEISYQNDTVTFYPLQNYFYEQLKAVDTASVFIYKTTIKNSGIKDSMALSKDAFKNIAADCMQYNISDSSIKKFYKESLFYDESTDSYTFNYSTKNVHLPLQSASILLDKNTQQVKRIFLTIEKNYNDSSITEKISWKNNSNFSINRIISYTSGKENTEEIFVAWK